MTQMPWRCEVCKELIYNEDPDFTDNDGFVHIYDPNNESGEPKPKSKRVIIKAVHVKCMEDTGYSRKTTLIHDVGEWTSFVLRLSENTWVTKEILERLIEYWYINRGILVRQL